MRPGANTGRDNATDHPGKGQVPDLRQASQEGRDQGSLESCSQEKGEEMNVIPEKPILMSGAMVNATLADLKTQTRRIIKQFRCPKCNRVARHDHNSFSCDVCEMLFPITADWVESPYGKVGHRLWVRENWARGKDVNKLNGEKILYRAQQWPFDSQVKWKPSIHMFRKDSRIDLEITDIRVERLQDITAADCLAEGIDLPIPPNCEIRETPDGFDQWSKEKQEDWFQSAARTTYMARCIDADNHVTAFQELWDSINGKPKPGKPDYSWSQNPWVWVITFKRVKP